MRTLYLFIGIAFVFGGEQVTYHGHQVIRAIVDTREQAEFLVELRSDYDFWTEVGIRRSVDICCPPEHLSDLHDLLRIQNIKFSVLVQDVQQLVDMYPMGPSGIISKAGHAMDWTNYHTIEDMHGYMDYLESTYDFVSTESIGKSYEGSVMRILKVCRGGCGQKPAMWVDGGIHGREWISPAVATYMMRELVENDGDHPDMTAALDWYFLPVLNPDGYLFSQGSERYWRKTRTENEPWTGTGICMGKDANRNWGYHWGDPGASAEPCDDAFMGTEAFSEVENRNVRDFILANKNSIKFYNSLHSFGQMVLLPWGFSQSQPDNYDDIYNLAMLGAESLKAVHGTSFDVGCIPCLLYPASGGTIDWVLGVAGVPYSMAMELRDHSDWALAPELIIPSGEETWAFHETVAREIIKEFGRQP